MKKRISFIGALLLAFLSTHAFAQEPVKKDTQKVNKKTVIKTGKENLTKEQQENIKYFQREDANKAPAKTSTKVEKTIPRR